MQFRARFLRKIVLTAVGMILGVASTANAAIIIDLFPVVGPSFNSTTPSTGPTFAANALQALQTLSNGTVYAGGVAPGGFATSTPAVGNSATPGFYRGSVGGGFHLNAPQIIGSGGAGGFASWNGLADPATNFGAAFAGERGNSLYFGIRAYATAGETFNLTNIFGQAPPGLAGPPFSSVLTSNDVEPAPGGFFDTPNFTTATPPEFPPPTYDFPLVQAYDAAFAAIPDGAAAATAASSFFLVGPGVEDLSTPFAGTDQERLDQAIAELYALRSPGGNEGVTITYSFTLFTNPGSVAFATASVTALLDVPEPGSIAMWAGILGVGGIFQLVRRKRAKIA